MANLTEKENYLMTLRGECPEWVPIYTFGDMPGSSHAPASVMCEPLILSNFRFRGRRQGCVGSQLRSHP